ncbi:putative F420-0 ABC transporter substrate-binding protein [Microterricola viridarii]|uniref:Iron complex transport system substrate-binding protein n=1 Tax=Microterricola viridarii TaxID=412690 RepID=A0A1H1N990_9MICO|nr:putative F420-0 ABC transporter substrate-binding protein [Microterricola viridarii]SDR95651.1 iron complex transport system substrate-binding protein [Microterricola viridarii]
MFTLNPARRTARRPLAIGVAAASLALLAGCAAPASAPPGGVVSLPPTLEQSGTDYPLTIDNCGTEVTFEAAPERVITIKSTSTEALLALGLGERIVGTAFGDGPAAATWQAEAEALPVLSDKLPGQEATLELEPDLVYAGWESNLSAEGAGDRATLAALGVNSLVSSAACKAEAYRPNPLTFDAVFADIEQLGEIFDVQDAAATLIAGQQAELAAVQPAGAGRTALWYSSGNDTPYVGAGIGAPQMILDALELENVAASVQDSWAPLGWEAIVAADPDVIVLVDAAWNTAESKIALLESNPATAELSAVQAGRYLTVPFPAGEAGVRNVEAVASLNTQLAALDG